MIGIALAAIAIGSNALEMRRKRASTTANAIASAEPIANPRSASFSVSQPAFHSVERCVQNALAIEPGFGNRNFWMLKTSIDACQTTMPRQKTAIAGIQSTTRARTVMPSPPCTEPCSSAPTPRSSSRTSVTSSKKRVSSRVSFVRGCGRSTSTAPAMRPGRGLITITRVDRNTASEIECVTNTTVDCIRRQISSSSMLRRSRVISSSAPNGSSIRSSAGSNASARAIATRICIPPESCQGWWSPNPCQLDELEHLVDPLLPLRAVPAEHLERQRDVLRHGAPVEEDGVLEDHPVVVVGARLRRAPSRSPRPCPRVGAIRSPIRRSIVDLPQPDGPISETNSPASIWRSIPCSAVTLPFGNVFVRPLISTTLMRRAPARGGRRASRRARPRGRRRCRAPAAITFVAHSFCGWSE